MDVAARELTIRQGVRPQEESKKTKSAEVEATVRVEK